MAETALWRNKQIEDEHRYFINRGFGANGQSPIGCRCGRVFDGFVAWSRHVHDAIVAPSEVGESNNA